MRNDGKVQIIIHLMYSARKKSKKLSKKFAHIKKVRIFAPALKKQFFEKGVKIVETQDVASMQLS